MVVLGMVFRISSLALDGVHDSIVEGITNENVGVGSRGCLGIGFQNCFMWDFDLLFDAELLLCCICMWVFGVGPL